MGIVLEKKRQWGYSKLLIVLISKEKKRSQFSLLLLLVVMPRILRRLQTKTIWSLTKRRRRRRRRRQRWEALKVLRHNPSIFLDICFSRFHCLCLFSIKLNCLQCLFIFEKIDNISRKVDVWRRRRNGAFEVSFERRMLAFFFRYSRAFFVFCN